MAYEYESTEARTLKAIQSKNYPDTNKDFVKNISRLNSSVDYISSYMGVMQKGIDDANQNIIEQIQGIFEDLWVLVAGGEPTGIEIGDLKYVFQAIGAIFGLGGAPFPFNIVNAVEHMFSNFLAFLPQFTDVIFDTIFAWAEALGVDPDFTGILRDAYDSAIEALSNSNNIIEIFAGVGGSIGDMLGGIGAYIFDEFIQPLINFISSAIGGPLGQTLSWVQAVISKIFGLASGADAKATKAIRAVKPLWEALDGNGEVSTLLSTADIEMNITSSQTRGGMILCKGGDLKQVIALIGYKSGTVSTFNLDIYVFNSLFGLDIVYSSPDLASTLETTSTVFFHEMDIDDAFVTQSDTFYAVFGRMTGSGSVSIQGRQVQEAATALRPIYPGISRNPSSGGAAPSNILSSTLDSLYVRETPYFQLSTLADIVPQSFFVDFTTLSVTLWVKRNYGTFGFGSMEHVDVSDGELYLPGGFGSVHGYAAATYRYRVATERCRVGIRLGSDVNATDVFALLFSKLDLSSYAGLRMSHVSGNPSIRLVYGTSVHSFTEIGSWTSVPSMGDGDWVYLEYDPTDKHYRAYLNPDWNDPDLRTSGYGMLILDYDSDGQTMETAVNRTISARSGSVLFFRYDSYGSIRVDDFILEDWAEPV